MLTMVLTLVPQSAIILRRRERSQGEHVPGNFKQRVNQYAELRKICGEVWDLVSTRMIEATGQQLNSDVDGWSTAVDFTEGLLRSIGPLASDQQLELCRLLVKGKDRKGRTFGKRIFQMWLACFTQEQIAEAVGVHPEDKAVRVSGNLADLPSYQKAAAEHATEFEPPLHGCGEGTVHRVSSTFWRFASMARRPCILAPTFSSVLRRPGMASSVPGRTALGSQTRE